MISYLSFRRSLIVRTAPAALLLALAAGCGDKNAGAQTPGGAGGPKPPAAVSVINVKPERVALTNELPGRVEAMRVAQVRARIPGIVQKRVFEEGSDVKAGDVLFRIDPAPLRASLASAEAALARAEANLAQANLQVKRFKPLVKEAAISQQEFDNAQTAQKQAAADVAAARAARQTASLNLGYATVTAPISGRIGRAQVTEGALVGQGEATPLAVIQQVDPVYVNMTQSSAEVLKLRRAMAEGRLEKVGANQAKVTLVTEDGEVYPEPGTLLFSDLSVDQTTGAITLRAKVPNKNGILLPGMYVRARMDQAVNDAAILVPQQAVSRNSEGASVMLVGADNKVVVRRIRTERAAGPNWVVSEGLKEGEQVIVEGLQKAKPGEVVKATPWEGPTGSTPAVASAQPATKSAPADRAAAAKTSGNATSR